MAVTNETVPDKALNTKREPVGTNRMAGEDSKSDGAKAVNDSILILLIAWGAVLLLGFSLREFING